jgi:hypothetical protein
MQIHVEGADASGEVFARQVRPTLEVNPFLLAQTSEGPIVERVAEPGQIAERVVRIGIPAQRPHPGRAERSAIEADARIRLRWAETGEVDLINTVALQRGTGMVVSYWLPRLTYPDQNFHATLLVGTALGSSPSDHAAEEFLRASEPVAHTEWTWTTDRIKAEYAQGSPTAIRQFLERIAVAIRDMLQEPAVDTSEGPEALRRLFPLPQIGGGTVVAEPYRLSGATAYPTADGWNFGGTFSRSGRTDSRWRIHISLLVEQEGGGRGEMLPLAALSADVGSVTGFGDGHGWEIMTEPGVTRVHFDGRAVALAGLPASAADRMKVRLDVRTVVRAEE